MKEIFESKLMIGFILFIMAACYFNIKFNDEVVMEDDASSSNIVVLNK